MCQTVLTDFSILIKVPNLSPKSGRSFSLNTVYSGNKTGPRPTAVSVVHSIFNTEGKATNGFRALRGFLTQISARKTFSRGQRRPLLRSFADRWASLADKWSASVFDDDKAFKWPNEGSTEFLFISGVVPQTFIVRTVALIRKVAPPGEGTQTRVLKVRRRRLFALCSTLCCRFAVVRQPSAEHRQKKFPGAASILAFRQIVGLQTWPLTDEGRFASRNANSDSHLIRIIELSRLPQKNVSSAGKVSTFGCWGCGWRRG
jgi:hypothetical protein